jgi:hypothetical protein
MEAQVIQINKPNMRPERLLTTLFLKKKAMDMNTPASYKKVFKEELKRRNVKL